MAITTENPVRKETIKVGSIAQDNRSEYWWTLESDEEAGEGMWRTAEAILLFQNARQIDFYNYARMYGVRGLGYSNTNYSTGPMTVGKTQTDVRLRLNAAKSCVETAQAKIAKARPRPEFLTTDGDWAQKRRAKKLTQYLDGAFDLACTYEESANVFRDACIFGTGVLHVYADYDLGQVMTERCWIEEILVDDAEAQYGSPRQLFRTKLMHREELAIMFPKKIEMIRNAASSTYSSTTTKDMIQVKFGWHLPSAEGADDGRYACSIREGTLHAEPYDKLYFPFVFFRWTQGLRSFYGQGIIEQVYNTQLEINQTCQTIQQSIYFSAVPRVFLSDQAKVISQHLDNRVGGIVKYAGNKIPTFSTATANNPEMYQYLDYLWKKCFEQTGLSEMSSTSNKPAGLDAAVAMREYQDIESQRFAIVSQAWEKYFLEVGDLFIDLSKDLFEEDKNLTVNTKNSKFIESVKWKDVNLPNDKYIVRCFPTALLPTQPAGRLQKVQELIQAGFIDKELGMNLLDFPDLDRVISLKNAASDNALQVLEKIVDEGQYDTPEPYMNLDVCIQLGQGMYLKARSEGVSAERQALLRRFIDDCFDLKTTQAPPPETQPLAAPMPQPTSNLVPNVAGV